MENVAKPVLESATVSDLGAVVRLLSEAKLPVGDVEPHIGEFILAKWNEEVIGTVGLEFYGEVALLRSLSVAAAYRDSGAGATLLRAAEATAYVRGVRELHLLTDGAERYFERHGFTPYSREEAPADIRQTVQYRELCPSSTIMRKGLKPAAFHFTKGLLPIRQDIPGANMWRVGLDTTMMTYFEVDANVRFEAHQHEGEQITTVVDGELFFETADGTVRVGAGDAIAIPAGVTHAVFTLERPARAFDSWSAPFPSSSQATGVE